MGATEALELEHGGTKGLCQEAGLFSCVPEGLANPRGSCSGLRMTSENTELIPIILYGSCLFEDLDKIRLSPHDLTSMGKFPFHHPAKSSRPMPLAPAL